MRRCWIVCLSFVLFAIPFFAWADEADDWGTIPEPEDQPGYDGSGEDDEGDREIRNDYPDSPTVPVPFPRTRFYFQVNSASYSGREYVTDANGNLVTDQDGYLEYNDRSVAPVVLNPGASIALLDDKLGLQFDLGLSINQGDAPSPVTMAHFGLGVSYVAYESGSMIVMVGLYNKLGNDSMESFFSPDYLYMRPYATLGYRIWRFTLQPFLGLPKYFDTNEDNDPGTITCNMGTCTLTGKKESRFPNRIPNVLADDQYLGIDYGLPISLSIYKGTYFSLTPSGTYWLVPETLMYNYITPGIGYRQENFNAMFGIQFRLPPKHKDQETWQVVLNAGYAF